MLRPKLYSGRLQAGEPALSNAYDAARIEQRWQRHWDEHHTFAALNPGEPGFDPAQPKYYVLDMFPYPSGSGLHVGHAVGYVGTDIVARRKRMEGCNVLHPMGWDAFGLPAEQYAIQTGAQPSEATRVNTDNFRRQLKKIGLSYDWARELNTSDPRYYKWTQWIFKRLFEKGLAYQAEVPVWWCEELKTVLANEEVINGRSERGNHPCVRRPLKQWMLKITAYAERLLEDLEHIDWPESIKIQQREWIGRSEGAEIAFEVEGTNERLVVFTTRPDTLWGATFMVLAPEHKLLARVPSAQRAAVESYVAQAASKSELERTELSKEKSGVFTGLFAHNPAFEPGDARGRIPIWVADYVLISYGTGAIMSVPGHDQRDFEFARKFGLEVREVVKPPSNEKGLADGVCFTGEGTALNSGPIDGLATAQAKRRAIELLESRGVGQARVTYKLRDWLFSRQRYWGEPFPLLHLDDGSIVAVDDSALPVELPPMEDFKPSADGSAPLARAQGWVRTTHQGRSARRDTDTMPGWAGSCWYWLRFMDPSNAQAPWSRAAEHYWGPVDLYVGGAAHAVMHLLYARFWHKVLFDLGLVHTNEPFQRLFNQGLITAFAYQDATGRLVASDEVESRGNNFVRRATGEPLEQIVTKMAKSLKNVVNPDDVIAEYGADTLRLYESFMGPLADSKPWNPRDITGCARFLERSWRLIVDPESGDAVRPQLRVDQGARALEGDTLELEKQLQRAIARIDESFKQFNFNTAIAALMSFLNEASKRHAALSRSQAERYVLVLSPFAPHMCEELWSRLGYTRSLARERWPAVEPEFLVDDTLEIVVQVAGKLRGKVAVPKDADQAAVEAAAKPAVASWLEGKSVVKVVLVPGRLINFIVK
ncbi:MAG: leucine--tRNA ligase [Planctomycetes bacterium]|nr:leucine--tRNA ligase [Planctomycetota bacterium]